MKESVLDVLMYLFENYMEDESFHADPEALRHQLSDAGFVNAQITKAFDWLQDLTNAEEDDEQQIVHGDSSFRVFHDSEIEKISLECRGFLYSLEQMGVIDQTSREHIIDRFMALESEDTDLEQFKWVVLMVLFNQPGYEDAFSTVENMLIDNPPKYFH